MADEDLKVKVGLDATGFDDGINRMRRGFTGFNDDITRSMSQVRRAVNDSAQLFNRLDLAQIAVEQGAERYAQAQSRYNAAVSEFGLNSEQATKAARDMAQAHTALEQAQQRSALSLGLVVAQSGQLVARMPAAIAGLRAFQTASLSAATAGAALANVVTLGAAAAGIIAGWMAIQSAFQGLGSEAKLASFDVSALKQELADSPAALAQAWVDSGAARTIETARSLADQAALKAGDAAYFETHRAALEADLALKRQVHDAGVTAVKDVQNELQLAAMHVDFLRDGLAKGAWLTRNNSGESSLITQEEVDRAVAQLEQVRSKRDAIFSAGTQKGLEQDIDRGAARLAELGKMAAQVQEQIAEGTTRASQAVTDSLTAGLNGFGVNLKALSADTLSALGAIDGPLGQLGARLAGVKQQEDGLAVAALKSSKSLRDQAAITADKDETTEHFHKRLLELGFTETEIAARVDETGRALRSQAEATRDAAQATEEFGNHGRSGGSSGGSASGGATRGSPSGDRQASPNGFTYGPSKGGAQQFMGLEGFMRSHLQEVVAGFMGSSVPTSLLPPMDLSGVAATLASGGNGIGVPGVGFWTGDVGDERRGRMVNALKNLIVKEAPATVWDSLLGQLGVNGFAHGIEGIIRKPGLFMAGEHGAESISVRPLALGDKPGQGAGTTLVFEPGSIVVKGADADDLMRKLRRLGLGA